MAYTKVDQTKPTTSQTRQAAIDLIRTNDNAISHAVIAGLLVDWEMTFSGGTAAEPSTITFTDKTLTSRKIRITFTWGTTGGENGQVKTAAWDWWNGSSYDSMASCTFSYDSSGNLTGNTNGGGMLMFVAQLLGKLKQHVALTGSSAHGLGTMSTQAASAVAITGGTADSVAITGGSINGTAIGGTTKSAVDYTRSRSSVNALGTKNASTALDWSAADAVTVTVQAGCAFTHSNRPNGVAQTLTIVGTNMGLVATATLFSGVKWAGGTAPTLSSSGIDIITLFTLSTSGDIYGILVGKGMA